MNPDEENPFWGEPTPTDLWDDMKKLNQCQIFTRQKKGFMKLMETLKLMK